MSDHTAWGSLVHAYAAFDDDRLIAALTEAGELSAELAAQAPRRCAVITAMVMLATSAYARHDHDLASLIAGAAEELTDALGQDLAVDGTRIPDTLEGLVMPDD